MTENWNVGANLGLNSGIDALTFGGLPNIFDVAKTKLQQSASNSDLFSQVFGDKANAAEIQSVRKQWAIGDFSQLPSVQILSAANMNGAYGAYASSNKNIYLSDSLFNLSAALTNSVLGAAGVLVEETFHWLDDRVGTDTKGDEGELARVLVFGGFVSNIELTRIKQEDDRGFIIVGGQSISVEQAGTNITVEAFGNTVLLKDQSNLLSAQVGSNTPFSIKYNGGQIYTGIFAGWETVAVETVGGQNQVLWKNAGTNSAVMWNMDSNWNYLSSSSVFALNSGGALVQETNFNIDLNGDSFVGAVNLEWKGSTKLVKDASNSLYAQVGSNTPVSIKYNGAQISTTIFAGWETVAVETVGGQNQVLWKNAATNSAVVWNMDSNWSYLSSGNLLALNSAAVLTQETNFGIDLNGDSFVGIFPDLVITGQTATSSVTVGGTVNIGAYTKNNGNANAGYSYVRYWLSNDTTLDSSDTSIDYSYISSINAGSSQYNSLSFAYNNSWGVGTKYILFQADGYNSVAESNESNNVAYATISVSGVPDLVITGQTATSSVTVGGTVNIGAYTKNNGNGNAVSNSYVLYWLSNDTTLDSTDTFIDYSYISPINAGSSQYSSLSFTYDSSWGTGTKYVLFEADRTNAITESNESNNVAYATIFVTSPSPDLVITGQTATSSVTVGGSVSVGAYTQNSSSANAGYNYVRYWLSNDTTLDSSDTSIGNSYISSINAGSSQYNNLSFTYDSSWGTGTKYILFQADGYNSVTESNESNNVAYATISVSGVPDLVIAGQTATSSVTSGGTVNIGAYTKNNGNGNAGYNYVRYWLSNDTTLDSSDTSIDYSYISSINAGSSQYNSLSFTYNSSWGVGTKYILFQADGYNSVAESNESNNVAYATIAVSGVPDLIITGQTATSSVTVGGTVSISGYTYNQGSAAAGANYVRYWLSDDATLNTSNDRFLGYNSVGSLSAGSTEYDSFSFTYDASWGTGTKYIFFEADGYAQVAESNESNNVVYTTIFVNPNVVTPATYQPFDASKVFSLNSNASANYTIYLDFDGHTTTGTSWNNNSFLDKSTGITTYTGNSIYTPAYSIDIDFTNFSETERRNIWEIWQRVAEDFIPFNVNVTTSLPSTSDLIKSDNTDTRWGVRVAIGGDNSWYKPGAGGVAYIDSFNLDSDTPAFVFSKNLFGTKAVAEAISHEVGHTLGLDHDGTANVGYYEGHPGWASIMGVGYYQELTQWSKGEYSGANNTQDDLYIITTKNGFGYRVDDYGSSLGSASNLSFSGSAVKTYGIIEQNTDSDWFTFNSTGGNLALNVNALELGANLDVLAELYNSTGQLLATYNPIDSLSVTISRYLNAGKYYIRLAGTGKGDLITGYSNYGSLGQYSITGTIV